MCNQSEIPFNSSVHFQTTFGMLSCDIRDNFLQWCQQSRQMPGGIEVTENILMESHLNQEVFLAFIREIASSYRTNECPKRIYDQACRNLLMSYQCFLRGRVSDLDIGFDLYRIVKLRYVQTMIADAMQQPDRKKAWEEYRISNHDRQRKILRIMVFPKKLVVGQENYKPVWSYHGESHSDPLEGRTAAQHLDYLGVSHNWEYEKGSSQHKNSAWKFSYRLCRSINRYIPTFVDAFSDTRPNWNSNFQVAQITNPPQYGRTRPIGEFLGEPGIPEVVHSRWDRNMETQTSYMHSLDFPG